jgi:transmembrane sensor
LPGNRVVEVLGTHFNVNAYTDEQTVNTTLLEGSVRVLTAEGEVLQLQPGQQAQMAVSGNKVVSGVDTDEIISWKEGWFNFNRTDVAAIMRQVSRWYNVDVVFEGAASQKTFSGVVSRKHNVSEVLKIMERAGVRFRIEGRTITVLQ